MENGKHEMSVTKGANKKEKKHTKNRLTERSKGFREEISVLAEENAALGENERLSITDCLTEYGKHEMSVIKEFDLLMLFANGYKKSTSTKQRILSLKNIYDKMSDIIEKNAELAEKECWSERLGGIADKIKYLEYEQSIVEPEPASEPETIKPEPFTIDQCLDTPKAQAMFKKFAEEGFIDFKEDGHYEWMGGKHKGLFCCFVVLASKYLKPKCRGEVPWSAFEKLFQQTQIQSYYKGHEYQAEKREEYNRIVGLFKRNDF